MDFFDDDATSGPTAPASSSPPPRRRTNRRRTRIQRLAVVAVVLFLLVFGIAWWAKSCQHSRKVGAYRTYFESVASAISDSDSLGKQLEQIVANPTRYSRKELTAKLDQLAAGQQEIAVRADRLDAPDPLADEQAQFATGMKVRADGFRLLRASLVAALGKKTASPAKLAALAGYFAGPDAYYTDLVYMQARQTMSDQGVTDVAVPTSTYYLTAKIFDRTRLQSMLTRIKGSSKLTGIHGVALKGVTAQPGGIALSASKTVDVPASSDLAFVVLVQNQGDVTESDVPVTVKLVLPGGSELKEQGTIAAITAGGTQKVTISGFAIPSEALSKVCTLKVEAGPVADEHVLSNNRGQFKFVLQLK